MISTTAKEFLSFWRDVRGDKLVPPSEDIHIERLESISAKTMYNVWNEEGELIVRYMGTDIVEAFGTDTTGVDQISLSHPDELEVSRISLGLVGAHPCGILATITLRVEDLTPRTFECIYLPVEYQGHNRHIIELVNPQSIDYRPEDDTGSLQALRYVDRQFIDIGAGTPSIEGLLSAYGACRLQDLTAS